MHCMIDNDSLAEKDALSRISKRSEKNALTMEQFVNLIEILKLSKYAESPFSQRGKSSMIHGKSKSKSKSKKKRK